MRQLFSLCFSLIIFSPVNDVQQSTIKAFKSAQSPVLDGRINEFFWRDAAPFSDFKMVEPTPGSDHSEKLKVRVIYVQSVICLHISNLIRYF
jgi:hypothetical protein